VVIFHGGAPSGNALDPRRGFRRRKRPLSNDFAVLGTNARAGSFESGWWQSFPGEPTMGIFFKDIQSFDDLFVHMLRDIYYAEKRILKSLPDMIAKASDPALKQALSSHLDETRTHIDRVEEVFRMHGAEVQVESCPAIDGIIEEAEDIGGEVEDKAVLDAAIIASAQAVEHYEITRYGTLIAWARQLGRQDCAAVLAETLEEEKAADEKLTMLAESGINAEAEIEEHA
jgi:ferritin-like metal-binding protein YciE